MLFFQIPLPVTSGLFLYLGVSGLGGNEMWERTKLLVTDKKLRPKNVSACICCYIRTGGVRVGCLALSFFLKMHSGRPGGLVGVLENLVVVVRFGHDVQRCLCVSL